MPTLNYIFDILTLRSDYCVLNFIIVYQQEILLLYICISVYIFLAVKFLNMCIDEYAMYIACALIYY